MQLSEPIHALGCVIRRQNRSKNCTSCQLVSPCTDIEAVHALRRNRALSLFWAADVVRSVYGRGGGVPLQLLLALPAAMPALQRGSACTLL